MSMLARIPILFSMLQEHHPGLWLHVSFGNKVKNFEQVLAYSVIQYFEKLREEDNLRPGVQIPSEAGDA